MKKKQIYAKMVLKMSSDLKKEKMSMTKPGSILYLMKGSQPSEQSLNIKIGNKLETLNNDFYKKMGVKQHHLQKNLIKGHQIDTLYLYNDTLEYVEQKANAGLDSEKMIQTIKKILEVKEGLNIQTNIKVNASILHTTVWEESDVPNYFSYYKKYRKAGIKVIFMSDYFKLLSVDITKQEFYDLWTKAGKILYNN